MSLILRVLSMVFFALAAIIAFGWFGIEHTPDTLLNVLGVVSIGLLLFAASFLPWPRYTR